MKTPALESLLNKVTSPQACNFTKKRLQHRCFPVNLAKFLWTPILKSVLCNKILLEKIRAVFDLNVKKTGWKKIRFQLVLNKNFCPAPRPLIHRRFMYRQRTEINKTILSVSPSSVFHTKLTTSVLKKSKYSILLITKLGPPVSESSAGSQHFMQPLVLTTNFIKRELKIGYP